MYNTDPLNKMNKLLTINLNTAGYYIIDAVKAENLVSKLA